MKKGFLTKITSSNGLWMTGAVLLLAASVQNLWFPLNEPKTSDSNVIRYLSESVLFGYSIGKLVSGHFVSHLIRFLCLLSSGLLLQYISTEFRLIRTRSYFPFFLFAFTTATILPFLPADLTALACFFFCLAMLRLFYSIDRGKTNRAVFDASLLLSLAALLLPRLILLMPAFWIIMMILRVFNGKSFLASLMGILSISWLIVGLSSLLGQYDYLDVFFKDMVQFRVLDSENTSLFNVIHLSFLGVLFVSAISFFWPRQYLDSLHTRNYLNSTLLLWFFLWGIWFFSGSVDGYRLPLYCMSSLVVAHFFSLVDTLYSRLLFILFVALPLVSYFI